MSPVGCADTAARSGMMVTLCNKEPVVVGTDPVALDRLGDGEGQRLCRWGRFFHPWIAIKDKTRDVTDPNARAPDLTRPFSQNK